MSDERIFADANLIAAAPTLADALEAVYAQWRTAKVVLNTTVLDEIEAALRAAGRLS